MNRLFKEYLCRYRQEVAKNPFSPGDSTPSPLPQQPAVINGRQAQEGESPARAASHNLAALLPGFASPPRANAASPQITSAASPRPEIVGVAGNGGSASPGSMGHANGGLSKLEAAVSSQNPLQSRLEFP